MTLLDTIVLKHVYLQACRSIIVKAEIQNLKVLIWKKNIKNFTVYNLHMFT